MELGEIDFAALLENQREKPLNMNFVALYWQQVSELCRDALRWPGTECTFLLQMLEAVQAVHDQNVVHTDLKPANFVLVKGKLKIIDFGIAKAIANDTVNIHRDTQVSPVSVTLRGRAKLKFLVY
jgi:serine/threonine-protein kinase TTK/MPS1